MSSSSEEVTEINSNQKLVLIAIIMLFIVIFIYIMWGSKFKIKKFKRRKGKRFFW